MIVLPLFHMDNNVKELIALAKARPGQLNFASSGNGSAA